MFEKSRNATTVRVVNVDPTITEEALCATFEIALPRSILNASLAAPDSRPNSLRTATITFHKDVDSRKALHLDGALVGSYNIGVDTNFLGLTVLVLPSNPEVE